MVDMREKLNERLRRLSELQDNWDGDGALAPREDRLNQALTLVHAITTGEFHIAPWVDGGLVFEWDDEESGTYVRFYLEENAERTDGTITIGGNGHD